MNKKSNHQNKEQPLSAKQSYTAAQKQLPKEFHNLMDKAVKPNHNQKK